MPFISIKEWDRLETDQSISVRMDSVSFNKAVNARGAPRSAPPCACIPKDPYGDCLPSKHAPPHRWTFGPLQRRTNLDLLSVIKLPNRPVREPTFHSCQFRQLCTSVVVCTCGDVGENRRDRKKGGWHSEWASKWSVSSFHFTAPFSTSMKTSVSSSHVSQI